MTEILNGPPPDLARLKTELLNHRRAQYMRLNGGAPIPMAGAVYWLSLAFVATQTDLAGWANLALPLSGLIFPLALLFAKLTRCNFMKDKSAVDDVLLPTLISMLLFWPMLVMAAKSAAPELVVPILAIGMSLHWPVIGWGYGRTALYTGHAVARAILVTAIWFLMPDQMLIAIPLAVAAIYILTVIAIYLDVARMKHRNHFTERMTS